MGIDYSPHTHGNPHIHGNPAQQADKQTGFKQFLYDD